MSEILDRVRQIWKTREVQRLASFSRIRSYNLAEHGYTTVNLFYILCKKEKLPVDMDDMIIVLNHDLLETRTGDLLWSAKNFNEATKQLWAKIEEEVTSREDFYLRSFMDSAIKKRFSGEKESLLQMFLDCDLFDLMLFCSREVLISPDLKIVLENCYRLLRDSPFESVRNLVKEIINGTTL